MLDHGTLGAPASASVSAALAEPEPDLRAPFSRPEPAEPAPRLRVGLLNNMPDTALMQTERQFRRLIGGGVELLPFSLDALPRGPLARAHLDRFYQPHTALAGAGLDALVVTGSEPKAARLDDEPYFPAFAATVDWAAASGVPTLFSCLAAHAAVLHLDRIERRPLPAKHSGVYACATQASHPLLAGLPLSARVPHSRWNDLPEAALTERGYRVLRRSAEVGVDLFVREDAGRAPMVFLQGHPEYDGDSLAREYRRDVGRFLEGVRETCPPLPEHYYTDASAERLEAFADRARAQHSAALYAEFPSMDATPPRPADWQPGAERLFRNWLALVAERRSLAPFARTA